MAARTLDVQQKTVKTSSYFLYVCACLLTLCPAPWPCQAAETGKPKNNSDQAVVFSDGTSTIARQIPSTLTSLRVGACGESGCNLTARCHNDTAMSLEDFRLGRTYAKQMYYSYGTVMPEAEFTKSYKFLGNFDVCREADPQSQGRPFSSQYCLATVTTKEQKRAELGVCFPNTCRDSEVAVILSHAMVAADVTSGKANVHCTKDEPLSTGAIIAIFICSLLGVTLTLATSYDIWLMRHLQRGANFVDSNKHVITGGEQQRMTRKSGIVTDIFLSFSVLKSYKRWTCLTQPAGTITCLHGIRVISCVWIILGHTYQYTGRYFPGIGRNSSRTC